MDLIREKNLLLGTLRMLPSFILAEDAQRLDETFSSHWKDKCPGHLVLSLWSAQNSKHFGQIQGTLRITPEIPKHEHVCKPSGNLAKGCSVLRAEAVLPAHKIHVAQRLG